MTTVLGALRNAKINVDLATSEFLRGGSPLGFFVIGIAMEQLSNAITALDNGKGPNDTIQESLFDDLELSDDLAEKIKRGGRAGEGGP